MKYHFTFKTNKDLEAAKKSGYDSTFDIVRVSFKDFHGNSMDIPLKSEEEYLNFINIRVPQQKITVDKIYQDKHGFDHGKLDYLNYLEENKKSMKNKMTTEEFKQYVIAEAKKLYKIQTLKEEKERIEKELSLLNECVPPTYDKDGKPNYIAGAPLMSPESLAKMRAEMLKKAIGWDFSQPKQLDEEKVNPWAICHASTGPEKDAKFERCVMDVKAKNKIKKESPDPANDAGSVKGNKP